MAAVPMGLDSPGYRARPETPPRLHWRPTLAAAVAVGVMLGIAIRTIGGYSQFIYFQF